VEKEGIGRRGEREEGGANAAGRREGTLRDREDGGAAAARRPFICGLLVSATSQERRR
jgi:hypothetical protein